MFSKSLTATCLLLITLLPLLGHAEEEKALQLTQTIVLPGVDDRLDHMAIDLAGRRLFVAALGNDTVEVVDLTTGTVGRVAGFEEPQGILYLNKSNRLFVTNGGNGRCDVLDGETLGPLEPLPLDGDADNIRYDGERVLYIGHGDGALAAIDAESQKMIGDIKLDAHPESFQLEQNGPKVFINVPNAAQIVVVDRNQQKIIATWPLTEGRANFPMALDEAHGRLLVGVRAPAKLLVLDTASGKTVTALDINADPDDIFYDAKSGRIYISCGEGFIDVITQRDADHYEMTEKVPTAAGARTSLWVPEWGQLFVAVPQGGEEASIRVFTSH